MLIAVLLLSSSPHAQVVRQVEVRIRVETVEPRRATPQEVRRIVAKAQSEMGGYLDRHPDEDICWNRPGQHDRPTCHDVVGITLPRQ